MKTKKVKTDPTKDAAAYPYLTVKKYQDPRYFRSWKDARAGIVKELTDLRDGFEMMGWQDSIDACNTIINEAGKLWPERGAVVQGLADPLSGQRYSCELVKRDRL